jgi:hypothetical protein
MFITEERARERLRSPANLANRFNIGNDKAIREESIYVQKEISQEKESSETPGCLRAESIQHKEIGRTGRRGPWLSVEERTEIAIEAKLGEKSQTEIAQEHGISRQGVAEINAGVGARDKNAVDEALETARNKALDRLMTTLGLITNDKLSALNAKDLSNIASNMAKVVEKTIPDADRNAAINLVIYSPELRSEKAFNSIEI